MTQVLGLDLGQPSLLSHVMYLLSHDELQYWYANDFIYLRHSNISHVHKCLCMNTSYFSIDEWLIMENEISRYEQHPIYFLESFTNGSIVLE